MNLSTKEYNIGDTFKFDTTEYEVVLGNTICEKVDEQCDHCDLGKRLLYQCSDDIKCMAKERKDKNDVIFICKN